MTQLGNSINHLGYSSTTITIDSLLLKMSDTTTAQQAMLQKLLDTLSPAQVTALLESQASAVPTIATTTAIESGSPSEPPALTESLSGAPEPPITPSTQPDLTQDAPEGEDMDIDIEEEEVVIDSQEKSKSVNEDLGMTEGIQGKGKESEKLAQAKKVLMDEVQSMLGVSHSIR
jgi:hypothetical protein